MLSRRGREIAAATEDGTTVLAALEKCVLTLNQVELLRKDGLMRVLVLREKGLFLA